MRSLRLKITLLNVIGISVALVVATTIGVISIANFGHDSSEESLRLLCKEGHDDLNDYFDSVEQSVDIVSDLLEEDLKNETLDINNKEANGLVDHTAKADLYFKEAVKHTEGVTTYYYRLDPTLTNQLGFWYTDEGDGLTYHTPTDLSTKEETDPSCSWYFKPKKDGTASWLLPYDTASLDDFIVISYNAPVYQQKEGQPKLFVGVVGIEISYKTLGDQIKDIKALETGYAFIVENEKGTIIYHPKIDLLSIPEDQRPQTPAEFVAGLKGEADSSGGRHIEYVYEGVQKHCYVVGLSNEDMSIVVCVPLREVNNLWLKVVGQIVVAALVVIAASILVTILFSRRLTKPLKDLTVAAEEINKGNYKVKLDCKGNDEIAVLTTTVNKLIEHLGGYISDLNSLAYADALTSVRNKGAFDIFTREMQARIDDSKNRPEFAIALFDCDDLKDINDSFGHDKGDVYLKNSTHLICRIFQNSPVYRVGGDEFVVVLQNEDYRHRESLKRFFIEKSAEICEFAKEPWEQIRVAVGIAVYNAETDHSVEDVMRRADHLMYENKHERKKSRN